MKMGEPVDWKAEHAKLSAGNAELVQKLAWSKETYDALAADRADIARDLHDVEGKNMALCGRIGALEAELASTKALWHEASGTVRLLKAELAASIRANNDLATAMAVKKHRNKALEALLVDVRRAWYGDGSVIDLARLDAALGSEAETACELKQWRCPCGQYSNGPKCSYCGHANYALNRSSEHGS